MYLRKASIINFRGIRKLNVDFQEDSTVLIGENHWGKTSLLRVLWMVLGQGEQLCQFSKDDLYVPVEIKDERSFIVSSDLKQKQRPAISFSENSFKYPIEASTEAIEKHPFSKFFSPFLRRNKKKNITKKVNGEKTFFDDLNCYIDKYLPELEQADKYEDTDRHIHVDLYFKESLVNDKAVLDESLKKFWYFDTDGEYTLHYQIVAFHDESSNTFVTRHSLLNQNNQTHKFDDDTKNAIKTIIRLNPVFRLRDSRMESTGAISADAKLQPKLKELVEKLANDNELSADYLNSMVNGLISNFGSFVEKYLTSYNDQDTNQNETQSVKRNLDDIVRRPVSLESLSNIKKMLKAPGVNKSKALASYISICMLISNKDREIDPNSHPIIILEDIEARFHPSLLLSLWSILEQTQSQRIVTTNSGDLLSAIPLEAIRRLDRRVYDTICYKIEEHALSYEDLRRIAFHIRLNRPMALFARTWILVEGETEVWLLTQIASILGISLPCEGIRIIEFAQCGLKPLIKLALELGINFHVLTDGDEAGIKYADTTKNFLGKKNHEKYLTVLPHKDIEHYLYAHGYEKTFKTAAGVISNKFFQKKSGSMDKIIEAAIKKKSKPGLALLLVDAISKKGFSGVPKELVKMIETVRIL